MKALHKLLAKYANSINYEAKTASDSIITFSNIKELLTHENYKKNRICSITVYGYNESNRVFLLDIEAFSGWFFPIGYINTSKCYYSLSSLSEEEHFCNDISSFFHKVTAPYWLAGKIRIWGIMWLFTTLHSFYNQLTKRPVNVTSPFIYLLSIIIALALLAVVAIVDRFVLENLFPPLAFMWGEEKERQKRIDNYRANLLWTVVIGIIVGIITTWITNKLF